MSRIRVAITVPATPQQVWDDLADVASHVEWMRDAVALRFTSDRTTGVGTTFDCDTRVGPLRLRDRMEITRWDPTRAMGVRHVGIVTGDGVITLTPRRRGRTRITWAERIRFPWWLGGPITAWFARPVLILVWRGSMRNLRARFTDPAPGG